MEKYILLKVGSPSTAVSVPSKNTSHLCVRHMQDPPMATTRESEEAVCDARERRKMQNREAQRRMRMYQHAQLSIVNYAWVATDVGCKGQRRANEALSSQRVTDLTPPVDFSDCTTYFAPNGSCDSLPSELHFATQPTLNAVEFQSWDFFSGITESDGALSDLTSEEVPCFSLEELDLPPQVLMTPAGLVQNVTETRSGPSTNAIHPSPMSVSIR